MSSRSEILLISSRTRGASRWLPVDYAMEGADADGEAAPGPNRERFCLQCCKERLEASEEGMDTGKHSREKNMKGMRWFISFRCHSGRVVEKSMPTRLLYSIGIMERSVYWRDPMGFALRPVS